MAPPQITLYPVGHNSNTLRFFFRRGIHFQLIRGLCLDAARWRCRPHRAEPARWFQAISEPGCDSETLVLRTWL